MKSVKALSLLLLIVKAVSSSADSTVEITSTSTVPPAPTLVANKPPVREPPPGPNRITTIGLASGYPLGDAGPVTTLGAGSVITLDAGPVTTELGGPRPDVTILPGGVETINPVITLPPTRILNGKPNASIITITSTSYSVSPGGVVTITTTNNDGETTTFPTYMPSATFEVIQAIESPIDSADSTSPSPVSSKSVYSGSSDSLNVKGLQGIGMGIIAVIFLNMFYALA
uniref:Genetic suppressor element 1 n=1 Tax=Anthurium amnicola TaxID=1678845 RepID=A0A1D1ZF44_9ARAE